MEHKNDYDVSLTEKCHSKCNARKILKYFCVLLYILCSNYHLKKCNNNVIYKMQNILEQWNIKVVTNSNLNIRICYYFDIQVKNREVNLLFF